MGPPRYAGPLGMMRSLGRLGVPVFGLSHRSRSAASVSRYSAGKVDVGCDGRPWEDESRTMLELEAAARRLGHGTILVAGSDEWAVFVAQHSAELARSFRFPRVSSAMVEQLAAKDGLYRLATRHGLPTPRIVFPANRAQAAIEAARLDYPVMLKPIHSRPDVLEKAVVEDADQLLAAYQRLEESPDEPNVMFQEYVPGRDQDVWIFNGYFDADSECLAAFTGVKVRQHPARMGIASLGELRQNNEVIEATCDFLRAVGYQGIVDIGYRFDARDGRYKVLDINPRLGGAFRMFVDDRGLDVARAMYLDLTGEQVPAAVVTDGRRWINESADLVSAWHYRRLEGLSFGGWLGSLRSVREGATWARDDPLPFFLTMAALARETAGAKWRRTRRRVRSAIARTIALRAKPGESAA